MAGARARKWDWLGRSAVGTERYGRSSQRGACTEPSSSLSAGADVHITDLPELLELMNTNIKLNSRARGCARCAGQRSTNLLARASTLVWGDVESIHPDYDVIIGADVLYVDRQAFDSLFETLRHVCSRHVRLRPVIALTPAWPDLALSLTSLEFGDISLRMDI